MIITMPVRGIWITPNTPGSKVPSHGTSEFGESYAIDFVMLHDAKGMKKPYRSSILKYIIRGVPLSDFYGWGQPVYSPISGKVVAIENGIMERRIVNPFTDLQYMRKATDGSGKYMTRNMELDMCFLQILSAACFHW